ncbi:MAG: DinB family protein [Bacteroidota bacterium]
MKLVEACTDILGQLEAVIQDLKDNDFTLPIQTLNNSTIGQHMRHTLEFFTCLMNHHDKGVINYDKRDHDKVIESDRTIALALIQDLKNFIQDVKSDAPLKLEANYSMDRDETISIDTNLFRELTYNIEHAIHHMAIIKIGLKEVAPYVSIPSHFGIAVSTIKYQKGAA